MRLLAGSFALAVATVSAQRSCTQSEHAYVYALDPQTRLANVTTSQACEHLCATSDCVAYLFGIENGAPACIHYLVVSMARLAVYGNLFMPPPWVAGRCGTQLPLVNGDFPGNDLTDEPSPDAAQCSYQCDETPDCHAFSWSNYEGGTCWMKTARPEVPTAPFDGSVVSGEALKCMVNDEGLDIVGNDLTSVPRASWRECCGVCRRTSGCGGTSWTDYNGGTCWLKTSADKGTTKGPPGVRSMRLLTNLV